MAHQLKGKTIASTFKQLIYRSTDVPATNDTTTRFMTSDGTPTSDISLPLYISTERVGIGEASPDHILHLYTIEGNPQICVQESSEEFLRMGVGETGHDMVIGWYGGTIDDLVFGTYDSVTDDTITSNVKITGEGYLIVGDDHGEASSGGLFLKSDASHMGMTIIENSGSEKWSIGVNATGSLIFADSGAANIRMQLSDDRGAIIGHPDIIDAYNTDTGLIGSEYMLSLGAVEDGNACLLLLTSSEDQAHKSRIDFCKADGNYAAMSDVADNEGLMMIRALGSDVTYGTIGPGGDFIEGMRLFAEVDGTPAQSANDMPTRVELWTNPNGSSDGVTRSMVWHANQYVSIRQATAAHALDVTGTAGLSTGTAWTDTSDERIKKDITTIPTSDALVKINALRPVSFKYTDEYLECVPDLDKDVTYNSFIAQEYQTVFPDAVTIRPEVTKITTAADTTVDPEIREVREVVYTDLLEYTPHDLHMYVVAAIQELTDRVTALENA